MIDKADYFKNMYDYIENLDQDIKTEDSLYEKRLATCKECERLADGYVQGLRLLRGNAGSRSKECLSV